MADAGNDTFFVADDRIACVIMGFIISKFFLRYKRVVL